MKKIFLITALAFCSMSQAQETSTKIKLQSATLGFGGFSFKKNNNEGGGITFIADATFSLNKNLFAASWLTGTEIAIIGNSEYKFNETALQYGREWEVTNWLRFEGFAGLGYYMQQTDYNDPDGNYIERGNAISFPLRVNTKFYFSKKFGMGLCTNYSINHINNNFSENLIFHYRFN